MICNYCGEKEATEAIPNPNVSGQCCNRNYWDVCIDCKEEIERAIKEDLKMLFATCVTDVGGQK